MTASTDHDSRMLTALVRLHDALQAAPLPLDAPGAPELRAKRQQLIDQLGDYVLPRQMSVEAPLLVVVGGSTGAGKSTLVNSLVGRRVTAPGLLRPTTRSAVLVHHPDDAGWFGQDRLLPELVRVDHATNDRHALQLVAADTVPLGLAILDAPDIDSVEEGNRLLAAQLLAVADLWLFVTSAARYADQVPWDHLKWAAERSTAVAIVLDRTAAEFVPTVSSHLARMLAARGLKDSPLFTVDESWVSPEGLLEPAKVAEVRQWLESLAADTDARSAVVRQTLDGNVRAMARQAHVLADAVGDQLIARDALRGAVSAAYEGALTAALAACTDGSLLRGEVAGRWAELSGTGDLLRSIEGSKGSAQRAVGVTASIESAVELLVLDQAEAAAGSIAAAWAELGTAGAIHDRDDHDLTRADPDLRRRVEEEVRAWHQQLDELVASDDPERSTTRYLEHGSSGLAVTLAVAVIADNAPGSESARMARPLLDGVFGGHQALRLVARGRVDLERRVTALIDDERARFLRLLDSLPLDEDAGRQLRAAARRVDDRRFEQTRPVDEPLP